MRKISLLLICSILFIGYTSAQSKKDKQVKFLPPNVQPDVPANNTGDGTTAKKSSTCVTCAQNLTPSDLSIKGVRKYGFINDNGELMIPRIYDDAGHFRDGYALVKIGDYYGTIDPHGSIIIPIKYTSVQRFQQTSFIASDGGFYGIINEHGKDVLPFIYDKIFQLDDNLIIEYRGKTGVYDYEQKKWIIPAKYKDINMYQEGQIFCLKANGKMDWYDKHTLTLIDSNYTSITNHSKGYFLVKKNGCYGIVDEKNTIYVPVIYQDFPSAYNSNTFLIAQKNNKYGIITFDNRVLTDFIYDLITIDNNLFVVQQNGLYGLIDKLTFKETAPCIYEDIRIFNSQHILAQKNGLYGIIKYDGTIVEDFTYEINKIGSTSIYRKGNQYGIINSNYSFITNAVYDEIKFFQTRYNQYFLTIKGKGKILLDTEGTPFANVSAYDDVTVNTSNIIVTKNKKYGMITKNAVEILIPIQYDLIIFDENERCFALDKGLYYEIVFDEYNKTTITLIK